MGRKFFRVRVASRGGGLIANASIPVPEPAALNGGELLPAGGQCVMVSAVSMFLAGVRSVIVPLISEALSTSMESIQIKPHAIQIIPQTLNIAPVTSRFRTSCG